MKRRVKENLRRAEAKIHFSFDMWSAPNHHAYQAIVAHWLDPDGKLHAALLDLHRFRGAHTGLNQAGHFYDTLNDYEIHHFVGKFNVDNASNNDTALEEISRRLQAEGSKAHSNNACSIIEHALLECAFGDTSDTG
jgi:hypothetical protein